jgi:C1A family cysteine protease
MKKFILLSFIVNISWASLPTKFTDLLPYVQKAPDQGETNTCWFQASTGAMELLLNKKYNIKNPKKNGRFDLSEIFTINQDLYPESEFKIELEEVVQKFNHGYAILNKDLPFKAWISKKDEIVNTDVWVWHDEYDQLPTLKVPQVETKFLFSEGDGKWSTDVLEKKHLEQMKKALVKYQSPLIVNYNDDDFWHVVMIVGFDDNKKGECYELEKRKCMKGVFYVRDSFGLGVEARSYEWFLKKGNTAFVVKLKN